MKRKKFLRKRILELCNQKGISEYELSYALGKNKNYIRKITYEGALPSMGAFFDICDYFNITPRDFFDTDIETPYLNNSINEILDKMDAEDVAFLYDLLKSYEKRVALLRSKK